MKVHESIPEFLEAESVDTVYSFISDGTLGVLSSLRTAHADAIEVIETRHEQAAVAMGDGYSRTSGEIGVAMVGRGSAIA
jgi:thiamine pyrophosphate-dependent acetolactate synthase large subunit-like protein